MEGGYNLRNPAVKRLMREAQELKDKTEQFSAYPLEDNLFEWHFTIRGPADSEFENGVYHGRIILPPDYPMKPPSIILLTPSGRFETNRKICLSISGFHPESWQPSWSLRTALLGIIGFMPTHGNGAIGSLDYTTEERKALAKKSHEWKCPNCGPIKELVLPITELSKELNKEAKELGQQINMQGEKQKALNEESTFTEVAAENMNASTNATPPTVPPVSSESTFAQQTDAVTSSSPQTSLPNASSFYAHQAPGTLPNFPFPAPPFPFMMPQFPFQFPPQGLAMPGTSQPSSQSAMDPYILTATLMQTLSMNPGQTPASLQNFVPFPSYFSGGFTLPVQSRSQQASPVTSTVTVSSETSPISSPSSNIGGARPKEPTQISKAPVAEPSVIKETKDKSNVSECSEPAATATHSNNVTETKDSNNSPMPTSPPKVTNDRVDDGDPVPLASTLRHRTTANVEQTSANRTNVPPETISSNRSSRYITRTGIVDAMTDVFIILLLFCIFGLLARRASMFL